MARAKPEKTKYECVLKKTVKGETVYFVKIKNHWDRERFTRIEDARGHRDRLRGEAAQGISLGNRATVRQYAEDVWLPHKEASGRVRAHVLDEYRSAFRAHIFPAFGDKRLSDVSALDVERFFDDLARAGKAPYTILNIRKPLNGIFDHATKKRLVPYNPVAATTPPEQKARRKRRVPTLADVWRLADEAPSDDDRNLILGAAFSGLRQSELLGLRWANVYLQAGDEYVRVVEQYYQGRHVPMAKTAEGNREVPLDKDGADVFRQQTMSARPNPLGLVFPSIKGAHVRASNWNRRVWQPMRERARVPEIDFHDLRAFYVSTIRAANLDPAWTMTLAGHADERTHDGYTHRLDGTAPLVRAALAGRFARPSDAKVSST